MKFKVKLRVTNAKGQREKYSFHLAEDHQFPLGRTTEGILHGNPSVAPEHCAVCLRDGEIRVVAFHDGITMNGTPVTDAALQVQDRFRMGDFTVECLEIIDETPADERDREPSISLILPPPEAHEPPPEPTRTQMRSAQAPLPETTSASIPLDEYTADQDIDAILGTGIHTSHRGERQSHDDRPSRDELRSHSEPPPEQVQLVEPGTLTMIRQEYDSTRANLELPDRAGRLDDVTRAGVSDTSEKTTATSLIQRGHQQEQKLTRYALYAAAALALIALPLYLDWGSKISGWFGKKETVAEFPVESSLPRKETASNWVPTSAENRVPAGANPTKPADSTPPNVAASAGAGSSAAGTPPQPASNSPTQNSPAQTSVPGGAAVAQSVSPPVPQVAEPIHGRVKDKEPEQDHFVAAELSYAAAFGNVKVLESMIAELGVDPNLFTEDGKTPLMSAAVNGQVEAVRFLLSKGAQVNSTDKMGTTALMWASMRGHFGVVRQLVEAGAEPGMPRSNGDTAIAVAKRWGHGKVEAFLRNPHGYLKAEARARSRGEAARRLASQKKTKKKLSKAPPPRAPVAKRRKRQDG